PGLSDATGYHWQARTVNSQGTSSDWVSFGGNAESAPDFSVSVPSASCPAEVIVDNLPAGQSIPTPAPSSSQVVVFTGTWVASASATAWGANASLSSSGTGTNTYTWKTPVLNASQACTYQVFVWWTAGSARATNVPYTVSNQTGGPKTKTFNQQTGGSAWTLHGTYTFPAGVRGIVMIS